MINLGFTIYLLRNPEDHFHFNFEIGALEITAFVIQAIFLIDMVANFIAISPGVLCEGRKIVYLELVLQIMFIGDLIVQSFYDFDKNRDDRYINTFVDPNKIAIIRNLRLFKYGNLIRDVVYVS